MESVSIYVLYPFLSIVSSWYVPETELSSCDTESFRIEVNTIVVIIIWIRARVPAWFLDVRFKVLFIKFSKFFF